MLKTKVDDPNLEKLPKIETNPRWLHFSHKSFAHNFRSFCCCFRSIRLKNESVKSLYYLTRKLPKVTNQHMITCFWYQTIRTSFLFILLLFPINMVKKWSEQKYTTLNSKICQKLKLTQDCYIFHPNLLHIILGHFVVVSDQYGSKINLPKVYLIWHENSRKLQTSTSWLVLAPTPSLHRFWSFYCCFPLVCLKNAQNKSIRP